MGKAKGLGFLLGCLVLLGGVSIATQTPVTIVALGDSTTAGTPGFRSPSEAPPDGVGNPESQYAYWMGQRHPEWKILNRGINRERSDEILERLSSDALSHHPQVLILLAGVNDLFQGNPPEFVIQNLKKMYERARQQKIQVVACTIIPYNGMGPTVESRMREVNGWIRRTAQEQNLAFCDLYHVVENPKHPGTLMTTADGLHPDVEGYRKMGEALADTLERLLALRSSS